MTVFICLFEPKKAAVKNGAIPLVIALEAINKKMASALAIAKLWESYPAAGDNFADPKVCEDNRTRRRQHHHVVSRSDL
ncbi:hypothetical protein ACVQFJ_001494 [Yersinia enterocolitica]